MRKFSMLLAFLAGMMLPLTAVAEPASKTSSSSKKGKSSKKTSKKKADSDKENSEEAPPENIALTAEQILLNNQAFDATAKGEFRKAEQIFQAMISIQELNIIWLNLANTYISENKCMEAADALERVYTSPRISDVPHEEIEKRAETYKQTMTEKCNSRVVLVCNPADMTVSIDGGQEMACSSNPIDLVPGRHVFYGQTSFGFNTVVANSVAFETTDVKIDVIDYETVAKDAGVMPESLRKRSKLFQTLGYTFIGIGAPVLATGIAFDVYFYYDYRNLYEQNRQNQNDVGGTEVTARQARNQKFIDAGYALITIGGAMLVTGIALVIVDAVKFKPQIEMLESASTSFNFAPVVSPEFAGFSLSASF